MRIRILIFYVLTIVGFLLPTSVFASVGSINPSHRISWLCTAESGNADCHDHSLVNWNLASSTAQKVAVTDNALTGWIWSEQIGWIHLAPTSTSTGSWGSGGNSHGVANNINGTLSGFAWAIAGSWVNFAPTHGGVSINTLNGQFSGWAWVSGFTDGGNWMYFDCSNMSDPNSACVQTDWGPPSGAGPGDPTASSTAGTYTSNQSVTLSASNATSIYYTVGATDLTTTDPTCSASSSILFSTPISVATSETIKAIGCTGALYSNVKAFDYVINIPIPIVVGDPVATPVAGTYTGTTTVTLFSASSTSILYTNDGNTPACPSGSSAGYGTTYATSTNIIISSTETIKAIGCNGIYNSNVVSFLYTITIPTPPTVSPPQASLPSGTYIGNQFITLSSDPLTTIHYATGPTGSVNNPDCSLVFSVYSSSISVATSETIKAIACDTSGNYSTIPSFDYLIIPTQNTTTTTTTQVVVNGTEAATTTSTSTTGIINFTVNTSTTFLTIATTTIPIINNVINATNVQIANVSRNIKNTAVLTQQVFTAPENVSKIQAVTTTGVVAGTAVSAASGLLFSSFSLADILFIPIRLWTLLMGILGFSKRKKPWGTVYDSVTKQPLDPAYVILRSLEGEDVATAITDLDGRYGFVVPKPGNYSLFVHKTNYIFPSQKLVGRDHDELYRDLYFGEHFSVTSSGDFVAKNIPMDPEKFDWNEFAKKSQHLMKFYSAREKWLSRISGFFFYTGFAVSTVALLFSVTKSNIVIFVLYIVLFFIRTFGLRSRPFGTIVSKETGKPVSFAIIRISQASTGVEMMHRVTDAIGRYYCLLPNGNYTVRIDQKLPDATYKPILEKMPVTVTKGYLSEKFSVSNILINTIPVVPVPEKVIPEKIIEIKNIPVVTPIVAEVPRPDDSNEYGE